MLTVISAHLSAYDEGGVYRKKQIELLKELIQTEYDNGNYVIVGGDFNHDIAEGESNFPTTQLKPDWIQILSSDEFGDNFKIVSDNTKPSCRDADIPWEEGVTYATVVDGFIISDNIELISVNNIISIDELELIYTEKREYSFQDTYYLKKDIDINSLTLQESEVEYVLWLSVEEINELIKEEKFRKGNISSFERIVNERN